MALPMASSAKVVTFGGFKCRVASFRVAGVGLCDILTCFITCPKLFYVASGILFCDVFRARFLRIAVSGLRQVVTTCKFRGRNAFCEMS